MNSPTRGANPKAKVPTLEGHPSYQKPAANTLPPGQSFRFKPQYRGKIRPSDSLEQDLDSTPDDRWLRLPVQPRRRRTRSAEPMIHQTNEPFHETFMISDIMASGSNNQQIDAEVRICCIIQVRMWPIENKVPLSTTGLIDVIKMARSWRKRAPDRPETKPTIVMSHNGVSRVGVYIGANMCIDQMDSDHEVDIFHAVKMMRINRPQLIDMKDEYKYLYDVMLHWYMTNADYRIHDKEETNEDEETENENVTSRPPSTRQSIRDKDHHRKSIRREK